MAENEVKVEATPVAPEAGSPVADAPKGERRGSRPNGKGQHRDGKGQRRPRQEEVKEYKESVVEINRISKTVKGGRRMRFSALIVVGNGKGKYGFGTGKAAEVPDAIKKAYKNAENNLIEVPIVNKSTIPHEVKSKYSASQVILKPAPKGKGIVASGTIRIVVELAGYTDIYTKSYGSRTKQNAAKVAISALKKLRTVEKLASLRDVPVEHILKK